MNVLLAKCDPITDFRASKKFLHELEVANNQQFWNFEFEIIFCPENLRQSSISSSLSNNGKISLLITWKEHKFEIVSLKYWLASAGW